MTASVWLANLASLSLQIGLLVAVAAALARLFRLRASPATLAFWQAVLLACLLLPFSQPWKRTVPASRTTVSAAAASPVAGSTWRADSGREWPSRWPSAEALLWTVAAGLAARALRIGLGLCMLRRLRRAAAPLDPECLPLDGAHQRLGPRAAFYASDRTAVPITFGLLRPAILLPPPVLEMEREGQRSILLHELLHVRRRDWVWAVFEEGVRSLLWFHPAVWWLIGRIHLTREQVVDQAVIGLTHSRERYVEALVEVARARTGALATASPFLRRGLLKKRVAAILLEGSMTTRRLSSYLLISAAVLVLAAGAGARVFPLEVRAAAAVPALAPEAGEPEQPAKDDRTPEQRTERLAEELNKALADTMATRAQREEWMHRLAETKARLEHLRAESVHKKIEEAGRDRQAMEELVAALADPTITPEQRAEYKGKLYRLSAEKRAMREDQEELRPISGTLKAIERERVSERGWRALLSRLEVREGDAIDEATVQRIRKAVTDVDEHYRAVFHVDGEGAVTLVVVGP